MLEYGICPRCGEWWLNGPVPQVGQCPGPCPPQVPGHALDAALEALNIWRREWAEYDAAKRRE